MWHRKLKPILVALSLISFLGVVGWPLRAQITQPFSVVAGTGISVVNNAGAYTVTSTVTSPTVLLHHGNGTDTTVGAASLDCFAVSGLTTKDTLRVEGTLESYGAGTVSTPGLYNSTDSVELVRAAVNLSTTVGSPLFAIIGDRNSSTTAITTWQSFNSDSKYQSATFTTVWTGTWNLCLRHQGAGTGIGYIWSVYKDAGQ